MYQTIVICGIHVDNQLGLVAYPTIHRVLVHPGWCRIYSINSTRLICWILPINTNFHLPHCPILKRMINDGLPRQVLDMSQGELVHIMYKYASICQGTLQENGTNRRMLLPENER